MNSYESQYLDQYRRRSFETILSRVRRDKTLEILNKHPHQTVIEVGAGVEAIFPSLSFQEYIVIEPASEMANTARAAAKGNSKVRVIQDRVENARAQVQMQSAIDVVIVNSVLHEVEDPVAFLEAVRSLCDPQTVVLINVPNVRSFHRILALEMGLIESLFADSEMDTRFQRRSHFDRDTLAEFLSENGFAVTRCESYFIKPFTHQQMEVLMGNTGLGERLIDGLARMTRHMPELGCELFVEARRA